MVSAFADWETEAPFTTKCIDLGMRCGWMVTHFRPVKDANGRHRTALQGHRGFPDLVFARDSIIVIAELKTNRGDFGPGQQEWLAALGAWAVVWRPRDWDDIVRVLTAPRGTQPAAAGLGDGRLLADTRAEAAALRAQLDQLAQLWHDRIADPATGLHDRIRRDGLVPGLALAAALDALLPK